MKRPRLSNPIVILAILFGLACMHVLLWQIVDGWMNFSHNAKDSIANLCIGVMMEGGIVWCVFAAYRKSTQRPLTVKSFWAGVFLIPFVGFMLDDVLYIFAQARDKAPTASCQSNLKQISLGILMYAQDWDENLPPAPQWATQTSTYTKDNADAPLWHCPTATSPYSYAMNRVLSGVSLSDVNQPESLINLFESDAAIWNMAGGKEVLPKPGRHNEGGNYAFFDGHVKFMSDGSARDANTVLWNFQKKAASQKP